MTLFTHKKSLIAPLNYTLQTANLLKSKLIGKKMNITLKKPAPH